MNYAIPVHFIQALADAFHDGLPFLLTQLALDLEDVIKLSSRAVLKQKVKVDLILKE